MARPSTAARDLSLPEELEKLEQSITLTLQEIDHNFSKAHRIVTTSILPLVEQYGEHSRAVWEASKFWKQFFEASANVSLSGYEELANDEDDQTATADESSTQMRNDTTVDEATAEQQDEADASTLSATRQLAGATLDEDGDESLLDDAELSGSTPRPPTTKTMDADISDLKSPYESMKRDMKEDEQEEGHTTVLEDDEDSTVLFAQRTARLPDMSLTPEVARRLMNSKDQFGQKPKDLLLHRVLDKNYRVQATPHKSQLRVSPLKQDMSTTKKTGKAGPSWKDDSPTSSPEMAIPKLRSEAFMSPFKSGNRNAAARQRLVTAAAAAARGPRTPGLSVQTPIGTTKTRDVFNRDDTGTPSGASQKGNAGKPSRKDHDMDWDSDDYEESADLYGGMSPPKTIQFALPASKLLQTPAREASRRIVDNILLDAGVDPESSEYSPTMVKMNENVLDDSF